MEMYHERPRGDETYAFLVWGVQMLCLYIEGKFADNSRYRARVGDTHLSEA